MSAIWGSITNNGNKLDMIIPAAMTKAMGDYKIDRINELCTSQAFFACGHQYFTPEAMGEELPYDHKEPHFLFTADCVLDNRTELLAVFPHLKSTCPDGHLLMESYIKWGTNVCDHLLGAFSFAVYEPDHDTLHLFTDHMGNRSLFYAIQKGQLVFNTALVPLARAIGASPCEKWLTGCLATVSADMMVFEDYTPYEGIFQLPAACHLTFSHGKVTKHIYWNASSLKAPFPHRDPMDYQKLFVDTLTSCTESMMRSAGRTGCTLSGGLDSSSIAALAARQLAKENRTLYSFTSVPLPGYQHDGDVTDIADETQFVKLTCEMYPNIVPRFLSCPEKDAFTELERLIPLIGYPMKSGHNLTWLDAIYQAAYEQGCKLMLKGQYGNSTISYGTSLTAFYQLLCSGQIRAAKELMQGFCTRYRIPRKTFLKCACKEWIHRWEPYFLDKEQSLARNDLLQKYKIRKNMASLLKSSGGSMMDSRRNRIAFMLNPTGQMQLGMFDTVMSLLHGVLIRDPSKDKRIIELCSRLPIECTMAGNVERGMVRTYMADIVPKEIREDLFHRGLQSSDYAYRSRLLWSKNCPKVSSMLEQSSIRNYVEPHKFDQLYQTIVTQPADKLTFDELRQANVYYSCCIFLNTFVTV